MAETGSAGDPILPTGDGLAGSQEFVALPPARVPREFIPRPAMPGIAIGQPIVDVPPLVEPTGFADPPEEIRPPAASRRPVRRRFLPPVSNPVSAAQDRSPVRDVRPRAPPRPQLASLPFEPGPIEPDARQASPSRQADTAVAPAALRRWRRKLLVGAGIAAALALPAALEVGVSVDGLSRLRGVLLHALAGSPALPSPGGPPGGLPADAARRVAYYTDRAKAGDADAQVALAILYAKGEGVAQDYPLAANWFRRAAEKGLMRAQYDLGVLYERGRGVPLDHAQAVAWYRKAAEQNHPLAQYNLAVAFTKGEGVRRDVFEAAVWYHRAAAQGVVAAMINLAILYEQGEGVDASTVDAYAWYRAAARRGNVPAARRADELLQAFSPWDQTRAEAKMADIAGSIHDTIGERSRLAARSAPAADAASASAGPAPMLKSGIESGRNSPTGGAPEAENP